MYYWYKTALTPKPYKYYRLIINLNINILVPIILNDILGVEMDQREVEVIRRDLYAMKDGELVTPL